MVSSNDKSERVGVRVAAERRPKPRGVVVVKVLHPVSEWVAAHGRVSHKDRCPASMIEISDRSIDLTLLRQSTAQLGDLATPTDLK
jgi:hypothetical protein